MDKRLLVYHAVLFEKYELPITSVIVYPFEFAGVEPPLLERKKGKEVLRFDYETLQLWTRDARLYMEQKAVPLYGLLPTMQGTSEDLLLQALDEMIQYYKDNQELLRDELLCFRVMLTRAQRLPEAEIAHIARRIRMFDPLLEEDPWVKEKVAEGIAKGINEGIAKGIAEEKLRSAKSSLLAVVRTRFPALIELAETKAAQTEQSDALNVLFVQLVAAIDEQAARGMLEQFAAS